jgi:hypothetical protein
MNIANVRTTQSIAMQGRSETPNSLAVPYRIATPERIASPKRTTLPKRIMPLKRFAPLLLDLSFLFPFIRFLSVPFTLCSDPFLYLIKNTRAAVR